MKLTDLNSIRLQMIYNATTNNKAALEYLLDMFDDTEEKWFPVCRKLILPFNKSCIRLGISLRDTLVKPGYVIAHSQMLNEENYTR